MLLKDTIGAYGAGATGGGGDPVTTEERILEDGEGRITEEGEARQTETSADPGGFTPLDLSGSEVFIDPLTSNLTFSSGAVTQQIDDQSGNARHHSQLTVAKQPINALVGGLQELTFDGADDSLQWAGAGFPLGPWTFFLACRHITRGSTGNTWLAATDGAGADEDVGWRGRYEGAAGNEAWALRMFTNGVLGTAVNISISQGGTLGDPVWIIATGDGAAPNRVVQLEASTGGTVNTVTTADPNNISNISIGERLAGSGLIGSNAHIGLYSFGIYSQQVAGSDLADLIVWLNDRITP